MRANGNGGIGQFSWANVIALATFIALLFGGSWVLFQAQFTSLQLSIAAAKVAVDKEAELLRQNTEARFLRDDLLINRLETGFITTAIKRDEFAQFQARIDDLKKRIEVIEATRPTADTLQTVSTGLDHRLSELRIEVQTLEARMDSLSKLSAPR